MGHYVGVWGQERVGLFQDGSYYNIFHVDGDDSIELGKL